MLVHTPVFFCAEQREVICRLQRAKDEHRWGSNYSVERRRGSVTWKSNKRCRRSSIGRKREKMDITVWLQRFATGREFHQDQKMSRR